MNKKITELKNLEKEYNKISDSNKTSSEELKNKINELNIEKQKNEKLIQENQKLKTDYNSNINKMNQTFLNKENDFNKKIDNLNLEIEQHKKIIKENETLYKEKEKQNCELNNELNLNYIPKINLLENENQELQEKINSMISKTEEKKQENNINNYSILSEITSKNSSNITIK